MTLKQPESMDECVYFTRRAIGTGRAVCWVIKEKCPKCGKGLMSKPRGDDGKVKIRAKEYVCVECNHTVEKKEYEESLTANIEYVCPACSFEGETQIPYKRKTYKGAKSLVFKCEKCGVEIAITKKMKETKKSTKKD